jgi:tRNA modification GTPase
MNAPPRDTIAAIATAAGRGGIGVVRVSGPGARVVAQALLGRAPAARRAELHDFRDDAGNAIDTGLALFFAAPHSFTGEDVLELHGHGGPVVLDLLLRRVLGLGARLAQPGEFTQRAFLNDKLDLAQAEAVADLIDSGSAQAARAAVRSLQGEFSARVHELAERALELRMWVEAAIDFPEEEIDFLADRALGDRMAHLRARFAELAEVTRQGALLRDGLTVVIAGRPNAGKSSLLNRLAGYEAAIVTDVPGTTRDVLRERIAIDGLPLHVLDTAGLREAGDAVEAEGIRRARAEIARADRVLFVVDAADPVAVAAIEHDLQHVPAKIPLTLVFNKVDRSGEAARLDAAPGAAPRLYVSAATGEGIDALREHLKQCVGFAPPAEGALSARTRHLDALRRARDHVEVAHRLLAERHAGELVAQELRDAHVALGEITGEVSSDDLLGRIFSSFCIGK